MKVKLVLLGAVLLTFPLFADTIVYTGVDGEQQYDITQTGIYEIDAYGAAGGSGYAVSSTVSGGMGAEIGGDFTLDAGAVLDLYVGQQGGDASPAFHGGGGGGGTFVVLDSTGAPLVVAGGGGGGGPTEFTGGNGGTDTSGGSGAGGSAGNSSGGGGFLGGGASVDGNGGGGGFPSLTGGAGYEGGANGGYGGGGGTAGGGGGYTGGDGAACGTCGGSGGSSYLEPSVAVTIDTAGNSGDGEVIIDYLGPAPSVPEPASFVLLATTLLGVAVIRKRVKKYSHR
jgi:hypothetical protein